MVAGRLNTKCPGAVPGEAPAGARGRWVAPRAPLFTCTGYTPDVEPVLVGLLTALTAVLGVAYFHLLVRPGVVLGMWADPDDEHTWFDGHPGALRLLRVVAAGLVFAAAFATGLSLTFLLGT